MNKRVLVVDDDIKTVELVKLYLNRDGYKVLVAYDGLEAIRIARQSHPDLIILDLMLPGCDGLEVCRTLRSELDVPIIMLTARTTEKDKLTGLDLGADDYVTKPFSPKELVARARAILRRQPDEVRGPGEIKFDNLALDTVRRQASLIDKPLNLTPVEFRLLAVFMQEPERVFSRAQLINKVFGYDFDGFDRTIDVHILNLRRKLGDCKYIKTVYGAGYKLSGNKA